MDFYKCSACGNTFADLGAAKASCKDTNPELLHPNTVDASLEKHVPVAKLIPSGVKIMVGSEPHPMTPEHHIEWIFVQTSFGGTFCTLHPGDPPEAELRLEAGEVESVYAFCNLHGLWKAKEPVLPLTFDVNDVACSAEFAKGCVNPSASESM